MISSTYHIAKIINPVSLMRIVQIKDPDELLIKHNNNDIVVEHKLDGWKIQAIKSDNIVKLYSRRGKELTDNFPNIVKDLNFLPNNSIIEGELVYWEKNKQLVDKITSLANSNTEKSLSLSKKLSGKIKFHIYDILKKLNKDLTTKEFLERRKILESTIKKSDKILITKQYPFSKWQDAMNEAVKNGGEGIVLKLKTAQYKQAPLGKREPKPANTMWKYKGSGGKVKSDDYVVYDSVVGDKGKFKVLFGQYYKGKLYHISELSNFSLENIKEIKKRLKKGNFIIEIEFQERVPKGLRHQRFLRFRDDKNPKDATMNEFHVKNIDKLKIATNINKKSSITPTVEEFIQYARNVIDSLKSKHGYYSKSRDFSGLVSSPNVDIEKAYKIIANLESKNSFVVGDSGTSFGAVQVQFGSFLRGLAADPKVKSITGLSPIELKRLASAWSNSYRKMRKIRSFLFKQVPVDEDAVRQTMKNKRRVVRRREGTTIRHSPGGKPGFVKLKNGHFIGYAVDLDVIKRAGLNITPEVMAELYRITGRYITSAVVRNAIAKLLAKQQSKDIYNKFVSTFTRRKVQGNQSLRDLADRAVQRNFTSRVKSVVNDVIKYGYDTNVPGAYNIYQLIAIANASGVGRVRQFLKNKKIFGPGNLHYLQRANKYFTKSGISSSFPPNGGIAGFTRNRIAAVVSLASIPAPNYPLGGLAGSIAHTVHRYINKEKIPKEKCENLPISMISPQKDKFVVMLRHNAQFEDLKKLLPYKIKNINIEYIPNEIKTASNLPTFELSPDSIKPKNTEENERIRMKELSREENTISGGQGSMPLSFFQRYVVILDKAKKIIQEEEGPAFPEDIIKKNVINFVAQEHNMSTQDLEKMLGMPVEEFVKLNSVKNNLIKEAIINYKILSFPGQYAEDVKSGKRTYTIRQGDVPFEKHEVVQAMTYSGAKICRLYIISKELMSLGRIEKAFGKRVSQSLEHRFGPDHRFTIIRFEKFSHNEADDGDNKKKMEEVLIDDDKKLTRGQIKAHYSKPVIKNLIMSRIKDKPVLVYIGVGKNKKILKRNHDGKEIVIKNDDKSDIDNPNNYWYWVNRRVLSFHEVFDTKTKKGFVDIDIHGNVKLSKAKEYVTKYLIPVLKKEFKTTPKIYESGGKGLHIEFNLNKETQIDDLRKQLREILDNINKDLDWVSTKVIKGNGIRSDISIIHNKGSIRVPGSIGESTGKIKRKISQDVDDNSSLGKKHIYDNIEESGREGAFSLPQAMSVEPIDGSSGWHAADDLKIDAFNRKILFQKIGDR